MTWIAKPREKEASHRRARKRCADDRTTHHHAAGGIQARNVVRVEPHGQFEGASRTFQMAFGVGALAWFLCADGDRPVAHASCIYRIGGSRREAMAICVGREADDTFFRLGPRRRDRDLRLRVHAARSQP